MAEPAASRRARQVWAKLIAWYGARVADSYGPLPPEDWCKVIDAATVECLQRTMADIKADHPLHPPTFPQFESLVATHSRVVDTGPTIQERLIAFAVRNRSMTRDQLRQPWTYVYASGGVCVAVDVPRDGDAAGFRVRVDQLAED